MPPATTGQQATNRDDDVVIEVDDLLMQFGKQTVLSGLDLKVRRGETLVVLGGSGCGKSTLLRLMIGAITPTRGRIRLFGEDIAKVDESRLDALRRRADAVAAQLGLQVAGLREVRIDAPDRAPRPAPMAMPAMRAAAAPPPAAVAEDIVVSATVEAVVVLRPR